MPFWEIATVARETDVFPYWDGDADVWGDPTKIHRRLSTLLHGKWDLLNVMRNRENPLAADQAAQEALPAVREAFEMKPYDKTTRKGATDRDCYNAVDGLADWLDKVKKNSAPPPNSAGFMAQKSSGPLSPIKPIRPILLVPPVRPDQGSLATPPSRSATSPSSGSG